MALGKLEITDALPVFDEAGNQTGTAPRTAVIVPNAGKFTDDPAGAAGKGLVEDAGEFFLGEMMKDPGIVGRRPYHASFDEEARGAFLNPARWLRERNVPLDPDAVKARIQAGRDAAAGLSRSRNP